MPSLTLQTDNSRMVRQAHHDKKTKKGDLPMTSPLFIKL